MSAFWPELDETVARQRSNVDEASFLVLPPREQQQVRALVDRIGYSAAYEALSRAIYANLPGERDGHIAHSVHHNGNDFDLLDRHPQEPALRDVQSMERLIARPFGVTLVLHEIYHCARHHEAQFKAALPEKHRRVEQILRRANDVALDAAREGI